MTITRLLKDDRFHLFFVKNLLKLLDPTRINSDQINELIGNVEVYSKTLSDEYTTVVEENLVLLKDAASLVGGFKLLVNDTRAFLTKVDAKKNHLIVTVDNFLSIISDFLKVSRQPFVKFFKKY